jgi:hypothetical protein
MFGVACYLCCVTGPQPRRLRKMGADDEVATGVFPGERVFAGRAPIRYVLHPGRRESPGLVVVFSGAPPDGRPPRYHWYRVLDDTDWARLYVLDDHGAGDPPAPSWYLGPGWGRDVSDSICALIRRTMAEPSVERSCTVTAGSSMGGWAALYYGARTGAGHVIAGEPQTLLGNYLCGPAFHTIAEHITGGSSSPERAFLSSLVFDALRAAAPAPDVHVCCGRESPYLENHVAPLAEVLDELGVRRDLELFEGADHDTIAAEFPGFMVRTLDRIASTLPARDKSPSGR